jgi:hypothetical protein
MVQLVFYGSERSKTDEHQLRCFCNTNKEIFIGIEEKDSPEICIAMDKQTAIKFSKELRKQIAIISDERLD